MTIGAAPAASDSYRFAPEERPKFPGSPFVPTHPTARRIAYGCVALFTGIGATFCNGLVSVNFSSISGFLGLYVAKASLLPAIYVAMNASANLTLVKGRAQFGIPAVTRSLLLLYALADLVQLWHPGFGPAVMVRAVNGMTAASLVTVTIYYLTEACPPKLRPIAPVIGIGLTQLGLPLARLVPVDLLAAGQWRGLAMIELGVALGLLALIMTFRLPPSERSKAFQPVDLVTIGLAVPAMLLLCSVIGMGRYLWWFDTPWLGWALAAAVPLFGGVVLIETHRTRPLLQFGWLGSAGILRYVAIALFVRVALAEQTYGSVGFLISGGLTNDQLRTLFAIVAAAMLLGIVAAVMTLSERRLPWQVMAAALIVASGAWLDAHSTNLTRPPQLYLSQALIGFGTTLFVGPALLYGYSQLFKRGSDFLPSFSVMFSVTQNVGGLIGAGALGTYQVIRMHAHAAALAEHMSAGNPHIVARIQAGAAAVAGVVTGPAQRAAEGGGRLAQALQHEATVLAFNDVFWLVALLGVMTAAYIAYLLAATYTVRRLQQVPSGNQA